MVGDDAEEFCARPSVYATAVESLGWPLLRFIASIADALQWTDSLVRDSDDGVGWSAVMDLDRIPDEGLPWIAQLVGVDTIDKTGSG